MWRAFFDFLYVISFLIPGKKNRDWFRRDKCFDYHNKLQAIKQACPGMDWKHMRLAKGGGSLAFIVNDTVFKVRKFHLHDNSEKKFKYEKMITDAVAPVLPVQVPHIELIQAGEYLFYKTKFIPGRVLLDLPFKKVIQNNQKIGAQLGHIMYTLFNTEFPELKSIKPKNSNKNDCGLTHGDMCSNIIVNPETMDVVGIIDWEYASYASLMREFFGIFRVRRKMRQTDIAAFAMKTYWDLAHAKKAK
jgi:hypothetical protein